MQHPNFESFIFDNGSISACYLNTTLGVPCQQGSVPIAGVDARSVGDIQAAVKFAVQHNLRLVVKSTGHDLLARSTARGSFMIWTHHLKNITYNASFVPQSAPSTETYQAMTLEAGVQWHEAYDAAQAQGRVLVGGFSAGGSVGAAGGWLLGGGHSALSPQLGLGVDNVIELNVILSSGDYVTANSHSHPDLFWALRGGGGGTYGIVTSVTYRTHPSLPLTAVFLTANSTNSNTFRTFLTEFFRIQPNVSDAGFSGYALIGPNAMGWLYIAPNVTQAQANQTVDPFFAFANNLTSEGLNISMALTVPYPSFYAWYAQVYSAPGQQEVGTIAEIASRLINRDVIEKNPRSIADMVISMDGAIWHLVAGGAVSKVDPDSTGVNPAWRTALGHIVWGAGWDEGASASEIKQMRAVLAQGLQNLTDLVGSSAYFNEASMFEPNPKFTFFGNHYDKLKAIKNLYDPIGLFVVREGVGSDDWDASLNCRK